MRCVNVGIQSLNQSLDASLLMFSVLGILLSKILENFNVPPLSHSFGASGIFVLAYPELPLVHEGDVSPMGTRKLKSVPLGYAT